MALAWKEVPGAPAIVTRSATGYTGLAVPSSQRVFLNPRRAPTMTTIAIVALGAASGRQAA